jgi:atypical dual specificity phosphatase
MSVVASLRHFSLQIGDKRIYRDASLDIPGTGCTVLLGPSGTGKSTLLRTFAGLIQEHPAARLGGELFVHGLTDVPPGQPARPPALVEQRAAILMSSVWESMVAEWPRRALLTQADQKRVLADQLVAWGQTDLIAEWHKPLISLGQGARTRVIIVRKALLGAPLLMVDEPTANLRSENPAPILELLRALAREMPLLVITHHLQHARALADHVVLVASGRVQEQADAAAFFAHPRSESGQQFLRTGSCAEEPWTLPHAQEAELAEAEAWVDTQPMTPTATGAPQSAPVSTAPAVRAEPAEVVGRFDAVAAAMAEVARMDSPAMPRTAGSRTLALTNLGTEALAGVATLPAAPAYAGRVEAAVRTLAGRAAEQARARFAGGHWPRQGKEQPGYPEASPPGAVEGQVPRAADAPAAIDLGPLTWMAPAVVPAPRVRAPGVRGRGPRGFTWIVDGRLAGTPWPGIVAPVNDDLRALCDAGVTYLISFTEIEFPKDTLEPYQISSTHLPMPDMEVPSLADGLALCRWVDRLMEAGHPVAMHCKAGLGRTGTMLAMYCLWRQSGEVSATQTIRWVRGKNSGMIQSRMQEEFLDTFARWKNESQLRCVNA